MSSKDDINQVGNVPTGKDFFQFEQIGKILIYAVIARRAFLRRGNLEISMDCLVRGASNDEIKFLEKARKDYFLKYRRISRFFLFIPTIKRIIDYFY